MIRQHCCEMMTRQVEDWHCGMYVDKSSCPDAAIDFIAESGELESRGIDPWSGDVPDEFDDDRWLRSAQ